jgi:hypothetical protein
LRGALKTVGYTVCRNTIKRILKEQGIEPAVLATILVRAEVGLEAARRATSIWARWGSWPGWAIGFERYGRGRSKKLAPRRSVERP